MGITIFFSGQLKNEESFQQLMQTALAHAEEKEWPYHYVEEESDSIFYVKNDEVVEYNGPTRGMLIQPHKDAETLRLIFDNKLYLHSFIKTQFAPIQTHVEVIDFLRTIESRFENFKVMDEGEYYETDDLELLRQKLNQLSGLINKTEKLIENKLGFKVRKNVRISVKPKQKNRLSNEDKFNCN